MAYGLPKYEGRITVPTGGYTMSVTDSGGTASVTVLAAGDYYPAGVRASQGGVCGERRRQGREERRG